MPYTASQLINNSWYLSGVVGKGLETVSGEQLNDGLTMLNSLLAIKTANQRLIPYYDEFDFVGIIGQEEYFIPNLLLVQTLTFELNSVRYPMQFVNRNQYFGAARANNVNSLPYQFYVERTLDGANIFMYFFPENNYPFKIHGKFSLSDVFLNEDLLLRLDQFYIEYLRYALAEYMCQEYNITFQPQSEKKLNEIEAQIFDISPLDLTCKKKSMLTRQVGPDIYGQANIGKGWTRSN